MAECAPSKEIDHVESAWVIGGHGEGGRLGEVVKVRGAGGLGRDSGIKVGLAPLIREKDKASKGKEPSSGGRDNDRGVESSLGLHDIGASC